jgi:hypothetical protein
MQGVRTPLPAKSALFVEECKFQTNNFPQKRHSFIAQNQNFPHESHLFIAQNPKFSHNKVIFFANRKDVESYSQMPGKCILALEFSNFFCGEASRLRRSLAGASNQ